MVRESRHSDRRRFSGLVVLFLIASHAWAQVEVDLSTNSLAVGERLDYVVYLDYEEPEDVVLPPIEFDGLRLIDGPNIRPINRVTRNQRGRIVEIELGFEAVNAGRYVLDKVPIEVAGQVFQTPQRVVEIGERGDRSLVPSLSRWIVPDEPVLVGESHAVVLEIYNAREFLYPDSISVTAPAQAIFEEVQGLGRNRTRRIDGVTLYEIPVAVFMVTPSGAGTLVLESAVLEFGSVTSVTDSAQLTVVDAPAAISDSGAIGQFDLSVSAERTTMSATEAVSVTLRIEGTGNLHYLQLPALVLDGLVIDTERRSERLDAVQNGYTGHVERRIVLRPSGTGNGRVEVAPFFHYDPDLERVVRTQLPSVIIEITELNEPVGSDQSETRFELLDQEGIAAVEPANWYRNPVAMGIFAPGLIVFIVGALWKKRVSNAAGIVALAFVLLGAVPDSLPWAEIDSGMLREKAGDLGGAIHRFEAAHRRAPDSPGINHNLAVLYFRAGDIGRSVYAAREAVRLNPGSQVLRDTLRVVEDSPAIGPSVPIAHVVHPDTIFIAFAIAVNVFFVLLVVGGRFGTGRRHGLTAISQILAVVAAVALAGVLASSISTYNSQVGVPRSDVTLRRIPLPDAESWLDVSAGTCVRVIAQEGGFVLVETNLGLQGWVALEDLLFRENPALPVVRYRAFVL